MTTSVAGYRRFASSTLSQTLHYCLLPPKERIWRVIVNAVKTGGSWQRLPLPWSLGSLQVQERLHLAYRVALPPAGSVGQVASLETALQTAFPRAATELYRSISNENPLGLPSTHVLAEVKMVLCACFSKPRARYETDADTAPPQMATHDLDAAKKVPFAWVLAVCDACMSVQHGAAAFMARARAHSAGSCCWVFFLDNHQIT